MGKYQVTHTDIDIKNAQNLNIKLTFYEIQSEEKLPCVIYLHCNGGGRIEIIPLVPLVLAKGYHLMCFDFTGSGLSEGEFVTLGYKETFDA